MKKVILSHFILLSTICSINAQIDTNKNSVNSQYHEYIDSLFNTIHY